MSSRHVSTAKQSQRFLIINADDLGLAPGVTRGILELARLGTVTSASLLVNLPGSAEALAAARAQGLDLGVHLNLCVGRPLLPPEEVRSLIGPDGRFYGARAIVRRRLTGRLRLKEVEREWAAQIDWMLSEGMRPSHLDSHCHMHALPGLSQLILQLARRYNIPGVRPALAGQIIKAPFLPPIRITPLWSRRRATPNRPNFCVLTDSGPLFSAQSLQALVRALPPGRTELVCHPGHVDEELRRLDPLTVEREHDWLQLSRPLLLKVLADQGIQLVTW